MEDFGRPVLNHGQMTVEADLLANDAGAQLITVVGASKTGYDAVHLFASQGKKVDWIVRESGGGGVWMSLPCVMMGPWRVLLEHTATMRFMSWFSPCIWGDYDGYGFLRRLLHGTWLGRLIVHNLWEKIRWDTVAINRYRMDPSLAHLEPRERPRNYAKVPIPEEPTESKTSLQAVRHVTPFRLYRGIAPPGLTVNEEQSLAFIKMVHSTSNFIIAETQALWIYAYLNDKLPIDRRQVFWNTALTSRFGKWRYPWGFSQWYPEFVYDAIPYADMLLSDLGLNRQRKRRGKTGGLLREWFEGYTVHDYKGLNLEWKAQPLASPGAKEMSSAK
ncbi:hypothetical protein LTR99_008261 [Exophiala xenobiotica]|nr:hypothetical protein LTR99_008261 [Exophiala xenobiotica]